MNPPVRSRPSLSTLAALLFCLLLLPLAQPVSAAVDPKIDATLAALAEDPKTLRSALDVLAQSRDPRASRVLVALDEGRLTIAPGAVLIRTRDGQRVNAVDGQPWTGAAGDAPAMTNAVRRVLASSIERARLRSEDRAERLGAARALNDRPSASAEPALRAALAEEQDPEVVTALKLALAPLDLDSPDKDKKLAALAVLANDGELTVLGRLQPLASGDDPEIRAAAQKAITAIGDRQWLRDQGANLFYGLSLGSVLLLAALGLAITFGLMGVINMAHGELLMIGAYATYVVQNLFRAYLPGAFDWYLLAALPVAFLSAAAVGWALERVVLRHLYGRPLETLLATFGLSLILIQTVRLIFGAQNVEVANPSWLSGGIQLTQQLVLPYNRIATILFALAVLVTVWLLFQKTRLGLRVRAVTQNRGMAAAMGIDTRRVDAGTFALGAGVAGLAGVALSQLGNVGPELGQAYIVDSFMVVVLGGVGKLAGAVAGGMGLGIVNKFLEPSMGAVLGKIALLGFIILFIQWRPQGLFAMKGRAVEG